VAIVTALQVEYEAVRDRLTAWAPAPPHPQFTNLFGWVTGTMPRLDGTGSYRVVVAVAGESGNLRTEHATTRTIDRWRPRYLVFSGIAGGLRKTPDDTLTHGDVVISQTIWHYEYQKIVDGRHAPRGRDTFAADPGLVNAARAFDSPSGDWRNCGVPAPRPGHVPKAVLGVIGSGEKVIDDLDLPFVQAVRSFMPDVQAVEMEAAGACMAIQFAHAENKGVGFLMVRGISDMPKHAEVAPKAKDRVKRTMKAILDGDFGAIFDAFSSTAGTVNSGGAGTTIRDNWKPYASAIAAHFITRLIASGHWPEGPRR
jgi:nucleoside phosphorylase